VQGELVQGESPTRNDLPPGLLAFLEDERPDSPILKQRLAGHTKLGGWPAWIQSREMLGCDDLALQIDTLDFEDWPCGDSTILYCFRDPATGAWYQTCDMA
jgi:hypothetical protein